MESGEAMFFPKCNDVHMWFMSMPLDVVFVRRVKASPDPNYYEICSVRENLHPFKILPVRDGRASDTLEFAAGTVRTYGLKTGDQLCIS